MVRADLTGTVGHLMPCLIDAAGRDTEIELLARPHRHRAPAADPGHRRAGPGARRAAGRPRPAGRRRHDRRTDRVPQADLAPAARRGLPRGLPRRRHRRPGGDSARPSLAHWLAHAVRGWAPTAIRPSRMRETNPPMATISNPQLSIVRDVDNAVITVTYTITWSAFDQLTNLSYSETWKLIGDDTGQDGDNLPVGDDTIPMGSCSSRSAGCGRTARPRRRTPARRSAGTTSTRTTTASTSTTRSAPS